MIQSEKFQSFAGIDGCRLGWVAAHLTGKPNQWSLSWFLAPHLQELAFLEDPRNLSLIDIPIGLPDANQTLRLCDRATRAFLGSSGRGKVFSPPCREALKPGTTHREASRINARHTGRKISLQAYYIIPKIRETDQWLRQDPKRNSRLMESHPEAWFHYWNGQRPLEHPKKTRAGRQLRQQLLTEFLPECPHAVQEIIATHPRTQLQPDDALDALALALAAATTTHLHCLSGRADPDEHGLPRRILISSEVPPHHP